MSEHDRDDERLAELYRRGSVEEPAPELDRRILAAAASGPPRRRWPIAGLTTAAALVLTVALMLPNAVEEPAFEAPPAADAEAGEGARDDAMRPLQDRAPLRAKVEEVVVTSSLYRAAAPPEPMPLAADSAAPATPASPHYTAPGCTSSYALPPDAVIRSVPGGIVVRAGEELFRLRCVDGGWEREPVPPEDP